MSPPKDPRPDNYEMNAKICRLVEQCPFMYDRSHPQYLRKEVCDEAWIRIAKEMGESVFPCRERWRNIRTSFARSINTNKPSSANRTKPYYLHEELKFLARHITPGIPVRNRKRATSGSGEECEHIEVSVGEETFNGFERLSSMGGESTDTQNGHETGWQRLHQLPPHLNDDGGGGGGGALDEAIENDSCNSSLNGIDAKREDGPSSSRFARLPPPPLQAAPHSTLQRGSDEAEAAATLQQIHMSTTTCDGALCPPLAKRPRKDVETTTSASVDDAAGLEVGSAERRDANADAGLLQELQAELSNMNHRQRIHLKRRIYEALSEIYPLTTASACSDVTTAATSDATCSQLALASAANFIPNVTVNGGYSGNSTVHPADTNVANETENVPQIPANVPIIPAKRNGIGLRTRSRPTERLKANATTNSAAVKDEPETAD